MKAVLSPNSKGTPWQLAVQGDCKEVINEFLDFVEGDIDLFKMLIASSEPRNDKDHPSNPLTGLAAKDNVQAITRMLTIAKEGKKLLGKFFGPNEAGITPLYSARAFGRDEIAQTLLAFGAPDEKIDSLDAEIELSDPNAPLADSIIARFAHAVCTGNRKLLNAILTGVNPTAIEELFALNEEGHNPLHRAAAGGHIEIVKALLNFGIDPTVRNSAGETALDIARKEKEAEQESVDERIEAS